MSDKIEPTQEEIEPSAQPDSEVEAHSAESEELPWCGIQIGSSVVPGTDEAAPDATEAPSAE